MKITKNIYININKAVMFGIGILEYGITPSGLMIYIYFLCFNINFYYIYKNDKAR